MLVSAVDRSVPSCREVWRDGRLRRLVEKIEAGHGFIMLSRRSFAKTAMTAPWVLRAQQPPLKARVKIDTERVIGEIDPKIYGNFAEHLGRCIDGGIFEEKNPLSDGEGYRKDVLEAVRKLNVTILRWPGGNFSSNYMWKDSI